MFVREIAKRVGTKVYKYAYLVESRRVGEKVRQRLVLNLGPAEAVSTKRVDAVIAALRPLSSSPEGPAAPGVSVLVKNRIARLLGPVLVAEAIWDRLGICSVITRSLRKRKIELDVPLLLFGIVANRLVSPRSKLALTEWYPRVHIPGLLALWPDVHQFYRAMDALLDCKDTIEMHIAEQLRDLFNQDFSLVFYDLTSTYFEGRSCPLAAYGYSREHRDDKLQVALGLVVTGDGLPIASDVFVGNTADASRVSARVKDLKERFGIERTIFVGDRGILSAANVAALASEGYQYISSIPTGGELGKELVGLAGDLAGYRVVQQDKLLAKEVRREGDACRWIVCHSFERALVDSGQRERRVRAHIFICVLSYLLERVLELSLKDAGLQMTARRALDELETLQMVESEIDGHLLHGPTEGSETARTTLEALAISIPKATLTVLPSSTREPAEKARSAERTLF